MTQIDIMMPEEYADRVKDMCRTCADNGDQSLYFISLEFRFVVKYFTIQYNYQIILFDNFLALKFEDPCESSYHFVKCFYETDSEVNKTIYIKGFSKVDNINFLNT